MQAACRAQGPLSHGLDTAWSRARRTIVGFDAYPPAPFHLMDLQRYYAEQQRQCRDGDCVPGCQRDNDCFENEYCGADNRCAVGCRNDDSCPNGRICEDRACIVGCRDDAPTSFEVVGEIAHDRRVAL